MKLSLEAVLKLKQLDDKITDLYKKRTAMAEQLLQSGVDVEAFELNEETEQGHKFIRLRVVNNTRKFLNGESIFKGIYVNPVDIEIDLLKRKPKEGINEKSS